MTHTGTVLLLVMVAGCAVMLANGYKLDGKAAAIFFFILFKLIFFNLLSFLFPCLLIVMVIMHYYYGDHALLLW